MGVNIEKQFKIAVEKALAEKNISKASLQRMSGISYQTIANIFLCKPSSTSTMNKVLETLDIKFEFSM